MNANSFRSTGPTVSPRTGQLRFSGHETFTLRYPWLAKGVSAAKFQPQIFSSDDAIIQLGVGRNMVNSIRYWCESLRLIEAADQVRQGVVPTELGRRLILGEVDDARADELLGWDPYLEDVGTLWLLHYLLVASGTRAATWHLLFTQFAGDQFHRNQVPEWLEEQAAKSGSKVSRISLDRDLQVFLRTYLPSRGAKGLTEDSFDCPLVELGLLLDLGSDLYGFSRSPKRSLPDAIFQFALLDFWASQAPTTASMSFERIQYGAGAPGAAFKFAERELVERLERLPKSLSLDYRETAGSRTLYGSPPIDDETRLSLLARHYSEIQGGAHE